MLSVVMQISFWAWFDDVGRRAGHAAGAVARAMGQEEPDLYRDTWVRYLGYANEVGESFRPLVPVPVVWPATVLATAYVTADAIDKGRKAAAVSATPPHPPSHSLLTLPLTPVSPQAHAQDPTRVGVAVVDTFVWQSLASVAIPGFTINRLCAASLALLGSLTRWPLPVRRWTTTALGLAAIPLIITPIDRTVDFLMDSSLRKLYGTPGEPPTSH
ncbi:LOW QUALITY PROTEIN: mitochondrial fission process protein 1 [Corvus cornix cornix]|uniref:LOW QUALITY PROTEIN: mitochondrial fission process protein 1 n=1 Tax=Corvus cornix cornix TaxID=932674 RepID=UPI001951E228|nr:LOW QUALITY PROTEIN: mitochondrial fission process protein 1 [Corvus cornix cornix]